MSTTVRISEETHRRLVTLAGNSGRHMQAILEEAVAAYEDNAFWVSFETGYDRLSGDAEQWADVTAERTGEAPTLADDLDHS